ncbi:hypothetical protein VHUM_03073 [Vanrija humicola]|uniref:Nudix hydrolase domain-containing protein n=1 Tax=Vanrija humicola TaxID=5417 RepID=A0A7D8UZ98_VANHU|nr:hypothetical protein VHUM_03073 [Vanrija humicola]
MVVSPTNQLLLLQRVAASSSFASAHVFPGGNLSEYHETVPAVGTPGRHVDGEAYRLAAIRETFEESGILLAHPKGGKTDQLLDISEAQRQEGRGLVHGDKKRFTEWLEDVGGVADLDGLIPFTRWITPVQVPKRFTTQMYVYFLPLSTRVSSKEIVHTPTHDGGKEHTEAVFADPAAWLDKAAKGEVILFPPQLYLLHLLSDYLGPAHGTNYAAQRAALVEFLHKIPTGPSDHPLGRISWADKCISPVGLPITRADGRATLNLEHPGLELNGTTRGGDHDRVVLVSRLTGGPGTPGPTKVQVRWRDEALKEGVRNEGKL